MAESYINRVIRIGVEKTSNPTINFISKTSSSLVFTITNNDNSDAIIYYELDDTTPDSNQIILNANQTSSNITFSNLNENITYVLYVFALGLNKNRSYTVFNSQTVTNTGNL
jgi:hypothetical protein